MPFYGKEIFTMYFYTLLLNKFESLKYLLSLLGNGHFLDICVQRSGNSFCILYNFSVYPFLSLTLSQEKSCQLWWFIRIMHTFKFRRQSSCVYFQQNVTFYRKRSTFQNVWRQSSGTFCTWTLTSNVLKSTPFPIERHIYWRIKCNWKI